MSGSDDCTHLISSRNPDRPGAPARVIRLLAAVTIGAALSLPQVAFAHGDEEEVPARESVLQAIAYVVNTPDDLEMISDKVTDAAESKDVEGVNVAEVEQAMKALEEGDLAQARLLLEESIGAKVDLTGLDVRHVLQVPPGLASVSLATGEQAGTTVVTDEMPGRGSLTGTDAALVGAAAVVGLGGVLLSTRFRPEHSIHTLRRRAREGQGG